MFKRISFQEKVIFTKHLAVMVSSGIPLAEAIDSLREQTRNSTFRNLLTDVLKRVENGSTLADAMKANSKLFSELYINLIKVGEKSGTLDETLTFLASQMTKENALKKKLQAAMLYPGLVLSAAGIIGGFISFFILPKLIDLFESFDIELPFTTRLLLFTAYTMRDYGIYILLGIGAVILLFTFLLKTEKVKFAVHTLLLKLPIIGEFLTYVQLATFTRNLAILLKNAVPINQAMEITAKTLTNRSFRKDTLHIAKELEEGKPISEILAKRKYAKFPSIVVKMISVGEKTGKLDENLFYLSDFYEEDIDNISKNMTTLLEPILLVFIGLTVGFLALSIISPIYELTGSIR